MHQFLMIYLKFPISYVTNEPSSVLPFLSTVCPSWSCERASLPESAQVFLTPLLPEGQCNPRPVMALSRSINKCLLKILKAFWPKQALLKSDLLSLRIIVVWIIMVNSLSKCRKYLANTYRFPFQNISSLQVALLIWWPRCELELIDGKEAWWV